jgi:cytoskeletal protein RodZ
MSNLSEFLRETREKKEITLAEIAKGTAIRVHYLENLECGEYDKLPSYVHVYGFLVQYCKYVGIDFKTEVRPLLDKECKKETFGEVLQETDAAESKKTGGPLPVSRIATGVLVIIIIAAIALILRFNGFNSKKSAVNSTADTFEISEQVKVSDLPVIEESNIYLPLNVPTIPPPSDTSTIVYRVTLRFTDSCWVNIMVDGDNSTMLDFIAEQGNTRIVEFKKYFRMDVGNASGVVVNYGGRDYSGFGNYRQAVKNLYFSIDETGDLRRSNTKPAE